MIQSRYSSNNITVLSQDAADTIRVTTGVTGDPHLFVVHADGSTTMETCEAEGEQLYLSNPFIVIRGTNTHVNSSLTGVGGKVTTLKEVVTIRQKTVNFTDFAKLRS